MRGWGLWLTVSWAAIGACGDDDDAAAGEGEGEEGEGEGGEGEGEGDCSGCTALTGGLVFDGTAAAPATVVVRGDRIDRVAEADAVVAGAEVVDVSGQTILPGLIDAHVHTFVAPGPFDWPPPVALGGLQVNATLRAGVTTTLDLGSSSDDVFPMRDVLDAHDIVGPNLFAAGPMHTPTGGHPCVLYSYTSCAFVDDPAAAEAALADLLPREPDVLKIILEPGWAFAIPVLTLETVTTLLQGAEAAGVPAVTHVTRSTDMSDALDAGARVFTHIPFQDAIDDVLASRLANQGAVVITTLSFIDGIWRLGHGTLDELGDPELLDDVHQAVVDSLQTDEFEEFVTDPERLARIDEGQANMAANLGTLVGAGVTIAAGTDAGNPGVFHGLAMHREIALLVESGLTPAQAIEAGTRNGADLLGRDDLGRIAAGAVADLLIVDGDPTEDVSALSSVAAVWHDGELVDRDRLKIFH